MTPDSRQQTNSRARFLTGAPMRHIVVMTMAMGAGLLAIFLVDVADIWFLSLLEDEEITAALGFAGPILFFTLSICIGISIAMGALVARHIGAGEEEEARHFALNIFIYGAALAVLVTLVVWLAVPAMLSLMGAAGRTHQLAQDYLRIILVSMPVLSIGMSSGSVLRALGDAKRSAWSMLIGSGVNAVLDPVFIFTLGLGIHGAALASVAARLTMGFLGLYWIHHGHRFFLPLSRPAFRAQLAPFLAIALPAILTNIATPVGNGYVMTVMARFGDSAVSGTAILWRVAGVAFFAVFAMTASVGPIIGQNFGAKRFDRVRRTLSDALKFAALFVTVMALALYAGQGAIVAAFKAQGEAAVLIGFVYTWLAWMFVFDGALFTANASFNNLGRPRWSTAFNWGKATLGTIPVVTLGGMWFGAKGVLVGQAAGGAVFSVAAVVFCYRLIGAYERAEK